VALPLWLFWSAPGHVFDLGDRDMRLWLYQTVLRGASSQEDLSTYLDCDTLIALWPDLFLPKGVRQAWEDQHPNLRAVVVAVLRPGEHPAQRPWRVGISRYVGTDRSSQ